MTTEQKNRISEMRKAGMSYAEIADRLCITKEAVRSYCRNHKITAESAKPETTLPVCPQCGMPVHQIAGRKRNDSAPFPAVSSGGMPIRMRSDKKHCIITPVPDAEKPSQLMETLTENTVPMSAISKTVTRRMMRYEE